MNDLQFLQAFEAGTLPGQHFHHRDHIRLAWLYLRHYGWEVGLEKMRQGLQQLTRKHGLERKYHETMTVFWMRLVDHCMAQSPEAQDFEALVGCYPLLLNTGSIKQHYSAEVLYSEDARRDWVEPDLIPMPPQMLRS